MNDLIDSADALPTAARPLAFTGNEVQPQRAVARQRFNRESLRACGTSPTAESCGGATLALFGDPGLQVHLRFVAPWCGSNRYRRRLAASHFTFHRQRHMAAASHRQQTNRRPGVAQVKAARWSDPGAFALAGWSAMFPLTGWARRRPRSPCWTRFIVMPPGSPPHPSLPISGGEERRRRHSRAAGVSPTPCRRRRHVEDVTIRKIFCRIEGATGLPADF